MDALQWERIQGIFGAVVDLPREAQSGAIEQLCGSDETLRSEVRALLDEDARGGSLLDDGLSQLADEALDSDGVSALVHRQIGPYRLLRVLGEGGMGIVYLAERTDIGGLVAIKLLRDAWLSPMRRTRFALEQQTLVKLNHPSIARIYDASATGDGTPWFVMEYVDGTPLTEHLRGRGGGVRDDLMLFRQVCEAVQYAHSHAIIHRDLKPSNILVTGEGAVKLLDFGIAKQMDAMAEDGMRTVTGLRLMTPAYAAPEQRAGREAGVFTDVYALGVVLYEILTGRLPEPADEQSGRETQRPSAVVRAPGGTQARWQLSRREWADLDVLCMTALAADPKRRYSSVDAFLRDITAYLDGRVLEARPTSFTYTAGKFVRRNRLALGTAAASLLLLAGIATVFTVRLARARDAARLQAARTERIQQFMQNMLGDTDQEAGPANDLKVVTLLDRAAAQAASLHGDAETQVQLYKTIGSMYSRLGKYEQAEQVLKKALGNAEAAMGPQSARVASLLVDLGTVEGDRGKVKEGREEIERAMSILPANHVVADDPQTIDARLALGRIDLQSGQYQQAADLLTPITQMTPGPKGPTAYNVRDAVSALAEADIYTNQYDRAETASHRAITLDQQLFGDNHPQTANDVMNLASVDGSLGRFAEADRLYREGIATMKAWYGPEHPDVITASSILARVLISEKKLDEAQTILHEVLGTEERIYGPVHERVAFTVNALGELASREGKYREAEGYFSRTEAIYRAIYGPKSEHTAMAESNLGAVYLKEGRYAAAEEKLRPAVDTFADVSPKSNYLGLTRGRLGRTLLEMKRYGEAEEQLLAAEENMRAIAHPPLELREVRKALHALYLATHQPEQARHWQQNELGTVAAAARP